MKHYISTARLNTYKSILKIKSDDEVLRAYYWNKALCGAMYPAMQTLEVTLRNSLNEAIKNNHAGAYGSQDWWFEHLVKDIQNHKIAKMGPKQRKKWIDAQGRRKKKSYSEQQVLSIQKELKDEGRSPLRHDDVIGRLTFGFWVNLLGQDYEDVTNKSLLWPNLLSKAFPNTPHKPNRSKIESALRKIKDLRNRISHHEPIWKFYKTDQHGNPDYSQPLYGLNCSLNLLAEAYDNILDVIKWMSTDRYQSFIDGRLDIEFRKLCSKDGFYGYVNPAKIKIQAKKSIAKWELYQHLYAMQMGQVTNVSRKGRSILVLGINTPKI